MDEYINKTKFEELMRKKARNNFDLYYADKSKRYHAYAIGYSIAADEAHDFPSADVQPVKWISVDEALPKYDGLVLAVDKNNTIRLGIYTDLGWTSQFGNPMVAHITHWQPLPKPPKDGDAE